MEVERQLVREMTRGLQLLAGNLEKELKTGLSLLNHLKRIAAVDSRDWEKPSSALFGERGFAEREVFADGRARTTGVSYPAVRVPVEAETAGGTAPEPLSIGRDGPQELKAEMTGDRSLDKPEPILAAGIDQRPRTEPAKAHCQRGDTCRNQGQYDQAIAAYTDAIGLDPEFTPAFVKRGQAHRLKGEKDQAIRDFTRATRTDPNHAEAWIRRGNVYAETGQFDRAIGDYTQAIQVDPGQAFAYLNRGLVYVEKGEWDRAITDTTSALRCNPNLGRAYFLRGVAASGKGENDRALADFDRAIELAPHFSDAHKRRQEAAKAKEEQGSVPRIRLEPRPPTAADESPSSRVVANGATAGHSTLPPEVQPAGPRSGRELHGRHSRAAAKADPDAINVQLECPVCGASGSARLDRLGHVFQCKGCSKYFRIRPNGQLVAVVRTSANRWVEKAQLERARRGQGPFRGQRRRILLLAGLLAVVALGGWVFWRPAPPPPPLPELPVELGPRAELFANAWLSHDLALMRRLTATTSQRELWAWLKRHQPPAVQKPLDSSAVRPNIRIATQTIQQQANSMYLVVRIDGLPKSSILLQQEWLERGDTWYFMPPTASQRTSG
jgi:tetratricopeptide (TPR) repeat protein